MNTARWNASATISNGFIYIAGGYTSWYSSKTASVELYDPKIDKWTEITPMNEPRVAFALIESNGFLLAMGCSNVIEKFEPHNNRWLEVCDYVDWMANDKNNN